MCSHHGIAKHYYDKAANFTAQNNLLEAYEMAVNSYLIAGAGDVTGARARKGSLAANGTA